MNKHKAPDGGPTAEETAARAIGRGTTHARGNAPARVPLHYEVTNRPDGLPLPERLAPEAHGGHYYTPEDREKYDLVAGYDKGLAPGYDPSREIAEKAGSGGDERGKYEVKPWKSPSGEEGACLVKMNFDGSRSMVAILGVDPAGNVVQLPPNTVGLKKGWKFASVSDLNAKTKAAEEAHAKDEERRKAQENAKAPVQAAQPALQSSESPEQRKAREEADPVLQALRNGASKTTAEKADEAVKDRK